MINVDYSYMKSALERFKNFKNPVLDCSLINDNKYDHLIEILKDYNNKNNTSFYFDKERKEIFESNTKLDNKNIYDSFQSLENLLNYLEEKGFYNIALSESKKSEKEEEMIMNKVQESFELQLDKAEIVLASQMIVDKLQKTIESISSLLYEDVFFISDKIKLSYGKKTSDYWFNNVKLNLEKLINVSIETKEKISKLNFVLETGEEIKNLNDIAVDSIERKDDSQEDEEKRKTNDNKEILSKVHGEEEQENDEKEFRKLKDNIKENTDVKKGFNDVKISKGSKNKKQKELEALKTLLEDLKDGIEFERAFKNACLITGIKKKTLRKLLENYISKKKNLVR